MSFLTSLISYFKMDEVSGNLLDAHGSNDLTEHGTVGSTTGIINNARNSFSGSNYFTHADNADLSAGDTDFTFSAWVYVPAGYYNRRTVLAKDSTGNAAEYYFYHDSNTEKIVWQVYAGTGYTNGAAISSSGTFPRDVLVHVIVWHDSVNNQIGMCFNGVDETPVSHSAGVLDGTDTFYLGSDVYAQPFPGPIDETGMWRRVFTSQERSDLYNGGAGLAYSSFGGGGVITPAPTPIFGYINNPVSFGF